MIDQRISNEQYEARHINDILGISRNQLFFWVKTHRLVTPDFEQGIGTGNRNRFSRKNLLEMMIIKELSSFGIDLRNIELIKNSIDSSKVCHWEKDGVIYNDCPDDPSDYKKVSMDYYDWCFNGIFDVGMNISLDEEGGYRVEHWEWTNNPASEEKLRRLFGHMALVFINASLMARKLMEKLT